ncbi:MAG: RsmE family RNA methyltransferase [Pseudomonadota bacterium]
MTTRLYLAFDVNAKSHVLPAEECHYLLRVLRLKEGDAINIYNECAGEWEARLCTVTKMGCTVELTTQLREPCAEPLTRLVYAPLKHDAMAFLFEKATELGVTHLQPMTSDFSQKYALHEDKILRQLKQASQQCERLSVPVLLPVVRFDEVMREDTGAFGSVHIALERAEAPSFSAALSLLASTTPCTFVIGPEGGFSGREVDLAKSVPSVHVVSLGRTILRAETAAIVGMGAISMWRAI